MLIAQLLESIWAFVEGLVKGLRGDYDEPEEQEEDV